MTLHARPEDMRVVDPRSGDMRPATEYTYKTLRFYVCPTPDCGDYYGSGGMPDLAHAWNGQKVEDQGERELKGQSRYNNNRQSCGSCRERGIDVQRVLLEVAVNVPKVGPPTPELPMGHQPPPRLKVPVISDHG